jgi:hypothetical protein
MKTIGAHRFLAVQTERPTEKEKYDEEEKVSYLQSDSFLIVQMFVSVTY